MKQVSVWVWRQEKTAIPAQKPSGWQQIFSCSEFRSIQAFNKLDETHPDGFTESTNSNLDLIQKPPCWHTQDTVEWNIWALMAQSSWHTRLTITLHSPLRPPDRFSFTSSWHHWQGDGDRSHWLRPAIFNLFHLMAHTNKLLKFYDTPKNRYCVNLTKKNRYNSEPFTLNSYCWVDYCLFFFFLTIWGRRGQCPWLKSQVWHVLKMSVACHITPTENRCLRLSSYPLEGVPYWLLPPGHHILKPASPTGKSSLWAGPCLPVQSFSTQLPSI